MTRRAPPIDEDALFLEEIAAYLDAQELLPVALPICGDVPFDLLDAVAPEVSQPALHERECTPGPASLVQPVDTNSTAAMPVPAHQKQSRPSGTRTTAKVRNLSRERAQNELRQLRAQSKELECQLAAMHGTRRHAPSQQELILLATWERVAKRQLELRMSAEAENVRLKAQLEAQVALARNLHTSLSLQTGVYPAASLNFGPFVTPSVCVNLEDVAIYKQLLAELDDTWVQMDSVFQENGLSKMRVSSSIPSQATMKTRRSPCGSSTNRQSSLYIELIEAEVLPFERDLVFNVMWECWARREATKSKEHYLVFEQKPMEVIASITRVCINFKGNEMPLDLIHVARVYRDNDRLCYVWRGVTKADSHFPGVLIDETGWQVMKPTTCSSSPSTRGTEILTCWQLESKSRSGELDSSRVSPLTNLVISTAEAETMEVNSRMLKMLLQET